ncbi:MAG: sigma-54-dependent Fis family transcriptional regulator [Calditrichaeota bacterium]|nr:sigma-54-dependent Fis family transcriptional regulator [Calditrichota bacterium]HQU74259.1 sigma-54 dependent transcriptional regulator [Calditrichia bacterium]
MTLFPSNPILLIDDEEEFLLSAQLTLRSSGINNVELCSESTRVKSLLERREYAVILMDMVMPGVSGKELLPQIVGEYPYIPLIVTTALNDVETAVNAMKDGAFDYMVKPVDKSRLVSATRRAIEIREVRRENTLLKKYLLSDHLENPEAFAEIISGNSSMRSIFQYIEAVGRTSLPVLITGETGVGKELVARSVHFASQRKGNFITVNVAGLDDNLFSDTLFGHRRGAYTGADEDRRGLIEQAGGGTLFLDEIGDLSMESQVKLLRLLQEGKYYPLGSDVPKSSDARVVVATNVDLEEMQAAKKFRRDLYYRLKTHHVHIPSLRERPDDIPLLVDHFLEQASRELGKKPPTPPRELAVLLKTYHFPGNIRELEGMIYDAVSQHRSGTLSMETFKAKIANLPSAGGISHPAGHPEPATPEDDGHVTFSEKLPAMKDLEQRLIDEALRRADGNQTIAADLIGMTRKALNNRLIRSRKSSD